MFFRRNSKRKDDVVKTVSLQSFLTLNQVPISEDDLYRKKGFKSKTRLLALFLVSTLVLGVGLAIFPAGFLLASGFGMTPAFQEWNALPEELPEIAIAEKNTLYDKNGQVFATVYSQNRSSLSSFDEIGENNVNALVATEDSRFWENSGYDVKGTVRALVSGSGGGSGITQQLVKNLQFYNVAGTSDKDEAVERSITRKIKELKLAIGYDKKHDKKDIVLTYFNTVAMGAPNVYGLETASEHFFNKKSADLTLLESAVLIGSIQNPTIFNLDSEDEETVANYMARAEHVLDRMVETGYITAGDAETAKSEGLKFNRQPVSNGCASSKYPFYCEYVMDYLSKSPKLGDTQEERDAVINKGGLEIHTYLDPTAVEIVENRLKADYGAENRIAVPTAVVTPGTGAVVAIGSNRDWGEGAGKTMINLAEVPAGSGSVYKMITLATALAEGFKEPDLTFSSRCPLIDPNYDTPEGGVKNSDSCALQGGLMDYRKATAFSSNTWFTELEIKVGVSKVKDFARSVGLSAPDYITDRSISYTLGVTEDSAISMASAFATFSAGGLHCPATPIQSYAYADGTIPTIPENYDGSQDGCRQVLSPKNASIVLKAMRANVSGEFRGAFGNNFAVPGYQAVGKSGTNELFSSSWVVLSGDYAVYSNLFNPDTPTQGNQIDGVWYQGRETPWYEHVVAYSGSEILGALIAENGSKPLDFNSSDETVKNVPSDTNQKFVSMPNVKGMTPGTAVSTLEGLGVKTKVLKQTGANLPKQQAGTIVEQSIPVGERVKIDGKKVVELTIGKDG